MAAVRGERLLVCHKAFTQSPGPGIIEFPAGDPHTAIHG
jgi:hypothetical protein